MPEVEHLLEEEHDLGTHSVEIKELSTNELAEQNNWIGANQVRFNFTGSLPKEISSYLTWFI